MDYIFYLSNLIRFRFLFVAITYFFSTSLAYSADSCTSSTAYAELGTNQKCDLNAQDSGGCPGGTSCIIATENIPLTIEIKPIPIMDESGTVNVLGTINEAEIGGSKCMSNSECISNLCEANVCADGGVCSTCVDEGFTPSSGYSCCSGLTKNATTGKCDSTPLVPSAALTSVGTINSNSCEFKYTDELQDYIDNYLDQHTKELVSFIWLFGKEKGVEFQDWLPDDASNISDSDTKIYGNKSDYYPFYDSKLNNAEGGNNKYSKGDLNEPKGLHDIALPLKTAYAGQLGTFIAQEQELLAQVEQLQGDFTRDDYTATGNAYTSTTISGGEAGVDYYKALLEYYNAIAAREASLIASLDTTETDLKNYEDTVMDKLHSFKFDNDTYEPDQCHGGNDYTISQTMFKYDCVREIWQFRLKGPDGVERSDYFVDPVFRFTGATMKSLIKEVDRTRDNLTYEYKTYNPTIAALIGVGVGVMVSCIPYVGAVLAPMAGAAAGALAAEILAGAGDEGVFLTSVTSDIYTQMANASATAKAVEASGSVSSDAYIAQFDSAEKPENLLGLSQVALLYFLGYNGHFDFETGDSTFKTIANAQCGTQQGSNYGNQQNDILDTVIFWGDSSQYPVKTRKSFLSFNNGTTQGGLRYAISQLKWFYEQSKLARDETIRCLYGKITSLSSSGGNDYRGGTGASSYANQSVTATKAGSAVSADCPPSQPGCGESSVGLSKINLNLGSSSVDTKGQSNLNSTTSGNTSGSGLSSGSLSSAAVRTSYDKYDAANSKAFGSKYTTAKGTVKPSDTIKAAIKKISSSIPILTKSPYVASQMSALAAATAGATASAGPSGNIDLNDKNASSKKSTSWKTGGYGGGNTVGETQTQLAPALSGVSESELDSMLSASGNSKYNIGEDDELFTIISKRYVRSGFPALFKRKTNIESVQKAIESKTPSANGSGKKEVYEPWKNFRPSSQ